ncbi:hypothetical protein POM88_007093 [Heracleum sosnowskyi]|uniref:Uncharacterized protein n=1 Tax=Heracleum sosnowskyi TaxID=360622 RepID=A0AAD8N0L2_9APIA|nr:hypothetical protein POM88_007093 [Heracleum sosnowskyi]
MDTKREAPSMRNIPVINEFEDVFPEDLPGLPPDREIKSDVLNRLFKKYLDKYVIVTSAIFRFTSKDRGRSFRTFEDHVRSTEERKVICQVLKVRVLAKGSTILGHVGNSKGVLVDLEKRGDVSN